MTETSVLFLFHLFIGFTLSLVVGLVPASKTATQATLVNDFQGRARTTFKVDHRQFLRTWGLYTAIGVLITVVFLTLLETRTYLRNAGYDV